MLAELPRRLATVLAATIAAAALAAGVAAAPPASLEGAWSGGGTVVYPSGDSERARCRASFKKRGSDSYGMHAVCATASARVEQTAAVERVSANRFSGEFRNAEYNFTGSIHITLNGNSLTASLSGGGGSARFNLSK